MFAFQTGVEIPTPRASLVIIIINYYYYYSMGLCNQHPFFRALFGRGQSPLLFHIHHGDLENGGHAAAAALHVTQKTPMPSQVFGQHDGSLQRVSRATTPRYTKDLEI